MYDGTWNGFLTAVYHYYYDKQEVNQLVSALNFQPSLIDEYKKIITDCEKASKVEDAIFYKISTVSHDNILRCFFSELEGREAWILNYLRLGFKVGRKIDDMLGDQTALNVLKAARKVGAETHRMLGLLRFELMEGNIYYAHIEPDHNIITFIAPHFTKRFADQNWVIHDKKRNLAALYNTKKLLISYMDLSNIPSLHQDEKKFQELWKNYFRHIAIKSRINPKLQRQFIPKRYWKNLTEKQ